jgi:NADPH:quinone reductase-like Zn-dependent oxidoreductase
MRQLQLVAYGEPSDVIELNTLTEPALGPEDVFVSMEAATTALASTDCGSATGYAMRPVRRSRRFTRSWASS